MGMGYENNGFHFRILNWFEIPVHQRYRFEIFGVEGDYLDSKECPDGLDIDGFDPYSTCVLAFKDDEIVGCCRLTYNNPVGGSWVEKFFELPPFPCDRDNIAEVNKIGVSVKYRNKKELFDILKGMIHLVSLDATWKNMNYVIFCACRHMLKLFKLTGMPFIRLRDVKRKEYHGYFEKFLKEDDEIIPCIAYGDDIRRYCGYGT